MFSVQTRDTQTGSDPYVYHSYDFSHGLRFNLDVAIHLLQKGCLPKGKSRDFTLIRNSIVD